MFEDLLGEQSLRKKIKQAFDGETCPSCKSLDINIIYGFFMSSTKYVQSMECEVCGERWNWVYDSDLNIVDTEIGV